MDKLIKTTVIGDGFKSYKIKRIWTETLLDFDKIIEKFAYKEHTQKEDE